MIVIGPSQDSEPPLARIESRRLLGLPETTYAGNCPVRLPWSPASLTESAQLWR
jgi:hypothetical protein